MSNFYLTEAEEEREQAARRLPCSVCHARPGKRCRYSLVAGGWSLTSHTGRYLAAVDAGKVPAFAGGWRG